MSIRSTGLSDHEKPTAGGSGSIDDDVGGYTIDEFGQLFRISRSMVYNEARAGRVKISKIGDRSIITRTSARRYQRLIEAEAAAP